MSFTTLYKLYKTKVNVITELRNGHGSAPPVWEHISRRLYNESYNLFGHQSSEFWNSYKDSRLSEDEVAVLLSTYDNAFIEIHCLEKFSISCRKMHWIILANTKWDWSHFIDIADAAVELSENHDKRCLGMAIGCTSVCDPWEQDFKDIESWGIYAEIEKLKEEI